MDINYIAQLEDYSLLPPGTICRVAGTGSNKHKFDYVKDNTTVILGLMVKEVLVQAKLDGTITFRKVGEVAKTAAELKKDGKKPNKVTKE